MTSKPLKTFSFSCRNTSITAVSDSHDNLLETTSPELTVHSSLKKQGKKRHIIVSSDSDSEDFVKKSVGRWVISTIKLNG